ncbi:MAG TPA: glycosyltransferase family 1 protein [Gammaproteobacteria bacterium]|nr:glycosyltransferase family 1 protein [Gammaproteobacteria bacterium]
MLLVDVSFTAHCTAPTGVQRITREVYRELGRQGKALPVCFDRWLGSWRLLNPGEQARLDSPSVGRYTNNRHSWSLGDAALGTCARLLPHLFRNVGLPRGKLDGLVVPEKLESRTPRELRMMRARISGASVAVFHDLIPVKFPQYATRRSSKEFPRYLESLLHYDGVAAVSESSRQDLLDYWANEGVRNLPPVEAISPGTEPLFTQRAGPNDASALRPRVLMVATLEKRKNHAAVLEACELLWTQGIDFQLTLAGRLSKDTGRDVLEQIRTLENKRRPVSWIGHIGDEELRELYQTCRFTLHPSLYEGFGLPVLESLSAGKPCIVTDRGALAQVAEAGGCHVLDDPTPKAVAGAIRELLLDSVLYERLVGECRKRRFKRWDSYCDELTLWQRSLKKRAVD